MTPKAPAAGTPASARPSLRRRPERERLRSLPEPIPHDPNNIRTEPFDVDRPNYPPCLALLWDELPDLVHGRWDRHWTRKYKAFLRRPPHEQIDPNAPPEARFFDYRRTERLEAFVLILRVMIAHLDVRTMRVLVDAPDPLTDRQRGLSIVDLFIKTRLSVPRIEAAIDDLKTFGFEIWNPAEEGPRARRVPKQPRIRNPQRPGDPNPRTGSPYTALPALRVVGEELFTVFGLRAVLEHDRAKAKEEWDKVHAAAQAASEPSSPPPPPRRDRARPATPGNGQTRPNLSYSDIAATNKNFATALYGRRPRPPRQQPALSRVGPHRDAPPPPPPPSPAPSGTPATLDTLADLHEAEVAAKVPHWSTLPVIEREKLLEWFVGKRLGPADSDETRIRLTRELLRLWHPELFDECPF